MMMLVSYDIGHDNDDDMIMIMEENINFTIIHTNIKNPLKKN